MSNVIKHPMNYKVSTEKVNLAVLIRQNPEEGRKVYQFNRLVGMLKTLDYQGYTLFSKNDNSKVIESINPIVKDNVLRTSIGNFSIDKIKDIIVNDKRKEAEFTHGHYIYHFIAASTLVRR